MPPLISSPAAWRRRKVLASLQSTSRPLKTKYLGLASIVPHSLTLADPPKFQWKVPIKLIKYNKHLALNKYFCISLSIFSQTNESRTLGIVSEKSKEWSLTTARITRDLGLMTLKKYTPRLQNFHYMAVEFRKTKMKSLDRAHIIQISYSWRDGLKVQR